MTIVLKLAGESDKDFVWKLNELGYRDVGSRQFGAWDAKDQKLRFDRKWSALRYSLIVRDAQPVGAVSTTTEPTHIQLNEIPMLPLYQSQGVGTEVLRRVISTAARSRAAVRLRVLCMNRARSLYERIGFRTYDESETHLLMELLPGKSRL